MNIITRDFGEVDISENAVISFPNGLFAFENERRFVLISPLGTNAYPMWLQSIDNQDLCLIVFNPAEFYSDYSVSIDKNDKDIINLNDNDTIDYLVIAVIPKDIKDTVVNLKAPVVINSSNNTAVQVIASEDYPLKHPAFIKD